MRVISGKFRGKIIPSPKQEIVKPTLDRVKENIFNILQFNITYTTCLDLFCGSGALGIECLSRGAKFVTFVDNNKENILQLNKFVSGLKCTNYETYVLDYYDFLKTCQKKYDIIFLDPPYDSNLGEIAIQKIFKFDLLSQNGIIVWEHKFTKLHRFSSKVYDSRTYGKIQIDFIKR